MLPSGEPSKEDPTCSIENLVPINPSKKVTTWCDTLYEDVLRAGPDWTGPRGDVEKIRKLAFAYPSCVLNMDIEIGLEGWHFVLQ
jgi:hypothetical protein